MGKVDFFSEALSISGRYGTLAQAALGQYAGPNTSGKGGVGNPKKIFFCLNIKLALNTSQS